MNVKQTVIRLAVSLLADNSNVIRKTDPLTASLFNAFGLETEEDRIARVLDEETTRAIDAAKRFNTNRKFKKITKDI